jgi:hypothetical protein
MADPRVLGEPYTDRGPRPRHGAGCLVGDGRVRRREIDVEQARLPAIMWVSKPITSPDCRACLFIIPIAAAAQRPGTLAALAPDRCCDLLDCLAQIAGRTGVQAKRHQRPSRTLSGRRAWLSSVTKPAGRGALADGTGAGPAAQQGLQLAQQLPQAQADAAGFGRPSRSKVRKPWATETKVTWWCQPPKLRPS